ncbi:MAG: LptF/LptG family permease [Gomphosphaeria aponina SAG 52.96 = DSM 107014]|uniref:LptF/LptG family permease n=1 Tax=Gomphosphaeria aponina SAG 52.96 = DSM 107014 TaxID=1521640 RepID=A0A941GTM8_9CHRO|nr:LptF/LptG family permease [Gomphosphaeria aponina SAG 52.96 = DSM 107014]
MKKIPQPSLMDRYIVTELIGPFLFSVGIFSAAGVAIGTLSDLGNKIFESGLPFSQAVQVFFLKLPEFTAYALPISVLLATLIAYGRLNKDSELIAFRSCGVSIYRVVTPAVILSLVVTGLTFLFNELIVPAANYQATRILVETINEEKPFLLTEDIFYPQYEQINEENGAKQRRLKSLFYAKKFDGKTMNNITVVNWANERLKEIIVAASASWNAEINSWDFSQVTLYQVTPETIREFETKQVEFPRAPLDLALKSRDPYEMNIAQAREYLEIIQFSGDEPKIMMFQVRTQQKIAFPFVCLVFGLVGSVLGCGQATGRGKSLGMSAGIVFMYYLLGFLIGALGLIGILSPFLAAWLPNFLGLGVGIWLLIKTAH